MPLYEVEGQKIRANSEADAYAQLDRMDELKELRQRSTGARFFSGVLDPIKEGYYGAKQLVTDLDEEDQTAVQAARDRLETSGVAGTVGEIATWMLPFGAAAKAGLKGTAALGGTSKLAKTLGVMGGEGALEGGYQALRPELEGDPSRLERGATGLASGIIGAGLGEGGSYVAKRLIKALGRPAAPTRDALRIERQGERTGTPIELSAGQQVDPGTLTGSIVKGVEEATSLIPGGGPLRRQQENALAQWNLSEMREMLPGFMRNEVKQSGPDGFQQLNDAFGRHYDDALAPVRGRTIDATDDVLDDLAAIEDTLLPRIAEADRAGTKADLDNLLEDLANGRITGDNFKETLKDLRKVAEVAGRNGELSKARVYKQLHDTLNKEVKRRLGPVKAAKLAEVDKAYAQVMPLVKGGGMAGAVKAGHFTPDQLRSGAQRGESEWSKASARSPATKRALAADKVFGTTLPRVGPGTAEKLASQAALSGVVGTGAALASGQDFGDSVLGAGLPAALGAPLVAGILGRPLLRRALTGRTGGQRQLRRNQKQLEKTLDKLKRQSQAAIIAGSRDYEE